MSGFRFDPATYLDEIREDIPRFDELQEQVAAAATGVEVRTMLELGTGTGETARRVLAAHCGARLVGIDESADMLAAAGLDDAELLAQRLQDPVPEGPFDLVFTALAVHHLDTAEKASLFRRARAALRAGGRFVLADVVVPERREDAVTPLTPGFDKPDPEPVLLRALEDAGFAARVAWSRQDLAVLIGDA